MATPILTSFSPFRAPIGTIITLVGSNFTGTTAVTFNGNAATFTIVNDSEISVIVPTTTTWNPIAVTNADGTGTSAENFVIDPYLAFQPCGGGAVSRNTPGTWAAVRDGAGTAAALINVADHALVGFYCSTPEAVYDWMSRAIFMFDTSMIPDGAVILSASLAVWGDGFYDTLSVDLGINVFEAVATSSDATLAASDYNTIADTELATVIPWASFNNSAYNTFILNSIGLGKINTTGVTKLGLRNANFDAANVEPMAAYSGSAYFSFDIRAVNLYKPVLVIEMDYDPVIVTLDIVWVDDHTVSVTPTIDSGGHTPTGITLNWDGTTSPVVSETSYEMDITHSGDTTAIITVTDETVVTTTKTVVFDGDSYPGDPIVPLLGCSLAIQDIVGNIATLLVSITPGDYAIASAQLVWNGVIEDVVDATAYSQTFVAAGTYTAILTVIDENADMVEDNLVIVIDPPTITSFTPSSGPIGTVVTLTGTGFTEVTSVQFNSTEAIFTIIGDTSITTTVPTGASTGKIRVRNPTGTGVSATNFIVVGRTESSVSFYQPGIGDHLDLKVQLVREGSKYILRLHDGTYFMGVRTIVI